MVLGLLLIAAALCRFIYNEQEAELAAQTAEQALQEIADTTHVLEQPQESEIQPIIPDYISDPTMEMPTVEVDGNFYIGVLEIPALELSLPIISEWNNTRLKQAPCRYQGSVYLDNLIIAGHNYKKHFGGLKNLQIGNTITFTDMNEHCFSYTVTALEELDGTAIESMESGDWDLTLFTCTIGGKKRVTVRCEKKYIK
ncbi:sortase [[Clostridium] symbiosum]|uniref:sortase n=1 Tax=Clostridium symbiosum TaxID=1512 RepID=UPI00189781C7|nr:sortase [[Clostridium] symbiosum]